MYHHNLKWLLLFGVQLLASRYFLYQFLHNHSIIVFCLTWCHFQMIITAKYYTFHHCGGPRRFELLMFTLNLVYCIGLVELMEETFRQSSLPPARRPIEEDVREVVWGSEFLEHVKSWLVETSSIFDGGGTVFLNPKSLFWGMHIDVKFCGKN